MAHTTNDHLRSPRVQWWFVVISGGLTLVCGTIGVAQYEREHLGHVDGLSPFYHAVQMLILHLPHFGGGLNLWIELGRWFGVLTCFGAALMLLWLRFRRELLLLRVGTWSNHWLICGLGRKGFELARHLKRRNPDARVVVLDPNPDAQFAEQCLEQGIGVVNGDAAAPAALKRAGAARAGEIIVITPSDETNVRIAAEIRTAQSAARRGPATCHVHLSDIHLREALQRLTETDRLNPGACAFHFFDAFDDEARRVLLQLPLDGGGLRADDRRSVHVAILGFGRMGRSLALRAAKMGHFANGKPLRLSIVDRAAELQRERFLFRYPAFADGRICLAEFHAAEVESPATRRWVGEWAEEPDTLLHLFVCLSEDARTLETALRLRAMLEGRPDTELLVRAHTHQSLARILDTIASGGRRLVPFGMTEDTCSLEAIRRECHDVLARAIHEQFLAHRRVDSPRDPDPDAVLAPWGELTEELRESNRQQADHIAIKLRAIGCGLADPESTGEPATSFTAAEVEVLARMEHARWLAERGLAGWTYAPRRNVERRENPYLVPWEQLTEEIQGYDRATVRLIPRLLENVGKTIRRTASAR